LGVSAVLVRRRAPRSPTLALPGSVVLEARDVSLAYGKARILDHVDLDVRAGEVLALVGPNGAGKSTLLGVLAGDLPATGSVTIDGAPIRSWTATELAMRRAVLLQQITLSFPFTVTQVTRMGRAPWARTTEEDRDDELVTAAMTETDVLHLATRGFSSLSGGEQSRAALARVLAQNARILLLDEPTASLDIRHQEQVLAIARERADRGDAVVVVMHDLGLAAAHADRIAVMARGRIRVCGPPSVALTEALLSDVYEHPIEIIRHVRTGDLIIQPQRRAR
jgi:iron complex transport system ATP-binding protein